MRYLATILNFFFPGAGYLVLRQKVPLAIAWLVGVIGLTYVELSIQAIDMKLYGIMFASVLIMNTAFAVDAWNLSKSMGKTSAQTRSNPPVTA